MPILRRLHTAYLTRPSWHVVNRPGQWRGYTSTESAADPDNAFPLPKSKLATPYDIFHLSSTATPADIKTRYYDLVKIYHPDRALAAAATAAATVDGREDSDGVQEAHDDFKRIREAYNVLGDERRRRMYDRAGIGWDPASSSSSGGSMAPDVPTWTGGAPRTPSEWAAYQAWSDAVSRAAPGTLHRRSWEFHRPGATGGHDRYGWQSYAGNANNPGADWFYGYGHAGQFRSANGRAPSGPRYTSNARFIASVASLTLVLGILQYGRFQQERRMILGVDDKRHISAVESLQEARKFARSEVGRVRMEELRKRARQQQEQRRDGGEVADVDGGWADVVGRGGPSGKEAYERRVRRLQSADG